MRSAISLKRRTNRICFNTASNRYNDEILVRNLTGCLLSFCRQAISLADSPVNNDQRRSLKANTVFNVRLISKNCT
ncbi:hypothetical protein GHT06_014961 [Daphnia sinensis]|uniref:Uncharacterized protein n=1 Tax=Daphnia sinensis TaxID=1820382 RepID=A0AAD5PUB7_9CRUS|nr:hypothetical protein GHT06_014961 [Daphnia sinensis]